MKKYSYIFLPIIVCIIHATNINGQQITDKLKSKLSGSLNVDSQIAFEKSEKAINNFSMVNEEQKKSIWLAAGLSAVLPGAGEFYSESYFKSAIFFTAEVAAITVGLIYNKKGDDQTISFQNYADQHWSVERYAKWTIKNASFINDEIKDVTQYKVFNTNGTVNWSELNRLEGAIGKYYSHHLPFYGEQQYYELIGKYPQFNVGWDDFGDENTPFQYGDPLTQKFLYYSGERGKANDFYNVASKAVLVVVVNHILSAIDAAWSTSRFNKEIEAHASIEKFNYGFNTVYYPQINLKFSF